MGSSLAKAKPASGSSWPTNSSSPELGSATSWRAFGSRPRVWTSFGGVDSGLDALAAADRERFRHFRHSLPELVNDTVRRSGALKMNTDYAVPVARNREMLAYYRRRLERQFSGRYVIFGHIGDAHVHVNIFSDPANRAPASDLLREFAREAVALGGTVSAEHGLGKRKRNLLELQYRAAEIEAMRAVKRRLDPGNILGRGTLWE